MTEREIEIATVAEIKTALDKVADLMSAASDVGIEVNFNIARGKKNRFEVQNFSAKVDLTVA